MSRPRCRRVRAGLAVLLLALPGLLGACSDASGPAVDESAIRGRVVDAHGGAVAGAAIALEYEWDYTAPGAGKAQLFVQFAVPQAGPVRVWLGSYCDEDTVRVLVDEELSAGIHDVPWDGLDGQGRLAPDDVYRLHVRAPGGDLDGRLPILNRGYVGLAFGGGVAAPAHSGRQGHFALGQGCLPFGETFLFRDEDGTVVGEYVVSRRVRVWAFGAGGTPAASEWVTVDPQSGANVTITLASGAAS